MSRGKPAKRKEKQPDPIYKSKVVAKLINMVMKGGNKSVASTMVYGAISRLDEDPKKAKVYFEDAIKNVMPEMEVRSRRVGGANYQIPVPVRHERSETLAIRWIIDSCRAQKGKPFKEKLAEQLQLAYAKEGAAIKKKDDAHRMAEANRAFAHFRW